MLIYGATILVSSCSITHRLNKEDQTWQPYKTGDLLIFEKTDKSIDSIIISKIEKFIDKGSVMDYALINHRNQIINVQGQVNKQINNSDFLYISKSKKQLFLRLHNYNVNKEENINVTLLDLKPFFYIDKLYGNCYLIDSIKYNKEFKTYYKSILFSKKFGYLKFNLVNGNNIVLKQFIRNGENIILTN